MFRNPINAFPYANAVDLTTNDKSLPISFTFQGDILRQWCVEIRDNDTDSVYYTSEVQNNINSPKYNGDICTLTLSNAGTSASNLSWSVYMNDSTTLLTAGQIVTDANTYQSNDFYFINCDTPTAILQINGETYETGSFSLNSRLLELQGTYNATSPFKCYQLSLQVSQDNFKTYEVVAESEKIFSQDIVFSYAGFDTTRDENDEYLNDYILYLTLTNQYDLTNVYTIPLILNFQQNISTGAYLYPSCNAQKTYNEITWTGNRNANPNITGEVVFLDKDTPNPDQTRMEIVSGSVIYDSFSGVPIRLENPDSCGFAFTVTIPLDLAIKRYNPPQVVPAVCEFAFDDQKFGTYTFRCGNGYLYCTINKPTDRVTTLPIFTFPAEVKFPLQPYPQPQANERYIWSDNILDSDKWKNDDVYYWLINNYSKLLVIVNTTPPHIRPVGGNPTDQITVISL